MGDTSSIRVGRTAVVKQASAVAKVGEKGVCYEEYLVGARPGWSFIFESGSYDGFNADEVDLFLELGHQCPEVADYEFTNVLRLAEDFRRGRFARAFEPAFETREKVSHG